MKGVLSLDRKTDFIWINRRRDEPRYWLKVSRTKALCLGNGRTYDTCLTRHDPLFPRSEHIDMPAALLK